MVVGIFGDIIVGGGVLISCCFMYFMSLYYLLKYLNFWDSMFWNWEIKIDMFEISV